MIRWGGQPPRLSATKGASIIERKETPQDRYDREHTVLISLKLNKRTDADILSAIEDKPKQTEIKRLLRAALAQK